MRIHRLQIGFTRVLMALAVIAATLPIFSGYLVGFCLLINLAANRLASRSAVAIPAEAEITARSFLVAVRPVDRGVTAMTLGLTVAALAALFRGGAGPEPAATYKVVVHMTIKWSLLWFVISRSVATLMRSGWRPRRLGSVFGIWLLFLTVYCVGQRYLGLDWTHGLAARLGPHRYAYGVYRISGLMGHPLTFAYNLVLLLMVAVGLYGIRSAPVAPTAGDAGGWVRRLWLLSAGLILLILLLSGSRFVLLVVPGVWILAEAPRLIGRWRILTPAVVAALALLWWEGSTLGRFRELLDPAVPLQQRFSRLVFWQAHWRMFLDHPLIGVSIADVDRVSGTYYDSMGVSDPSLRFSAHNLWLQTAADSGVAGLAGLVAFFSGLARTAVMTGRRHGAGARGPVWIFLATLLIAVVQNNLRDSEFVYALWLCLALLVAEAVSASPSVSPTQPAE